METWFSFEMVNGDWQFAGVFVRREDAEQWAHLWGAKLPTLLVSDVEMARSLSMLKRIDGEIKAFNRKCAREEHTDTDEAWRIFRWIRRGIRMVFTRARKRAGVTAKAAAKAKRTA